MMILKLSGRIKLFFNNLSEKTIRELIAIGIILSISVAISLPAFFSDMKKYQSYLAGRSEKESMRASTPEEQGMDSGLLKKADGSISNSSVLSFVVMRNGVIVHEKYSGNNDAYVCNNVFSVTKSVISALTGICIREGFIEGAEDRISKHLPEYMDGLEEKGWRDITIEHLLTMTPGFLEDPGKWSSSSDWVKATFQLPLLFRPGERFQYADSASHLLSVILTEASGISTYELAEKYLFEPMGITNKKWAQDPGGYYTGYANLFLTPRDMAKFGYLYLNKGSWEGKQLIPQEWVEESTKVRYDFNTPDSEGGVNGYGYNWWITEVSGYYMYSALGHGGQSINVLPDLGLVVVFTALPDSPVPFTDENRLAVLRDYVIPAVMD